MGLFSAIFACLEKTLRAGRRGGAAGVDEADEGLDSWNLFFELRALQIATNFFSDLNKLGHGGFGPVYKVLFRLLFFVFILGVFLFFICYFLTQLVLQIAGINGLFAMS